MEAASDLTLPLAPRVPARERILDTSYELFSRHGVKAVGVDTIIERSGVAKMTLYRHFRSKDELVLAFLRERENVWTVGWLQAEVAARAADPRERLLAIFDVFDGWFRRDDFEGCSFINLMLEAGWGNLASAPRASITSPPSAATSKALPTRRASPIPTTSPASGTS